MIKIILFFCLALIPLVHSHASISLKESFHAAKLNMESIKRAQALISRSEEQKVRARAAVLPVIAGVGSYTKIDTPEAAGNNPFLLTRQYSAALRLSQPLLRGGSLAAYDFAKESVTLAKFQKDATELNLYQLILSTYFGLAAAQMDKKNIEQLLALSRSRLQEIKKRTLIGRSRNGELVEAEAQLQMAQSQYQQILINLETHEKNFQFYTNLQSEEITLSQDLPILSSSLEDYLRKIRNRPDLLASNQQIKLSEKQVQIAKGGHYPQLDLTSNYYFDRTGILATSEWDIGLTVNIPLYQGGGVSASVKEALENKRVAHLEAMEDERAASRDIALNYHQLEQMRQQLKFLKEALIKSEEAYRLNKRDYQFGLVTNLDVLQSLNFFIETKRSFDNLVAMGHLSYWNLEALAGVLP